MRRSLVPGPSLIRTHRRALIPALAIAAVALLAMALPAVALPAAATAAAGAAPVIGDYCLECHVTPPATLLDEARPVEWARDIPCPTLRKAHEETYQNDTLVKAIQNAAGQISAPGIDLAAQEKRLAARRFTAARISEAEPVSLAAITAQGKSARYQLNKVYAALNEARAQQQRLIILGFVAAASAFLLVALFLAWRNSSKGQGTLHAEPRLPALAPGGRRHHLRPLRQPDLWRLAARDGGHGRGDRAADRRRPGRGRDQRRIPDLRPVLDAGQHRRPVERPRQGPGRRRPQRRRSGQPGQGGQRRGLLGAGPGRARERGLLARVDAGPGRLQRRSGWRPPRPGPGSCAPSPPNGSTWTRPWRGPCWNRPWARLAAIPTATTATWTFAPWPSSGPGWTRPGPRPCWTRSADPMLRAWGLREIGEPARAAEAARLITDPYDRAWSLREIAALGPGSGRGADLRRGAGRRGQGRGRAGPRVRPGRPGRRLGRDRRRPGAGGRRAASTPASTRRGPWRCTASAAASGSRDAFVKALAEAAPPWARSYDPDKYSAAIAADYAAVDAGAARRGRRQDRRHLLPRPGLPRHRAGCWLRRISAAGPTAGRQDHQPRDEGPGAGSGGLAVRRPQPWSSSVEDTSTLRDLGVRLAAVNPTGGSGPARQDGRQRRPVGRGAGRGHCHPRERQGPVGRGLRAGRCARPRHCA